MKINKTLFLIITILFVGIASSIPWPVAHQDSAHASNKTYGDWNGMQVIPDTTMGYHGGIDIPADSGTPVYAVIDGVVSNFRTGEVQRITEFKNNNFQTNEFLNISTKYSNSDLKYRSVRLYNIYTIEQRKYEGPDTFYFYDKIFV